MVKKRNILDELNPRLDKDFYAYMTAEHTYDTTLLRSIGYQSTFPNSTEGIKATIAWMKENRWIPA